MPTVIELGMIVSERKSPPPLPPPELVVPEPETVKVAPALVGPLNAAALAVIVAVPAPTAVATPDAFTVATETLFELQLTAVVMFCVEA